MIKHDDILVDRQANYEVGTLSMLCVATGKEG